MPENRSYEYVVIRLVPRVEREEFLNIGVVLYAPVGRFLQMKFHLDKKRLRALFPSVDVKMTQKYLESFQHICAGNADAGPIGKLTAPERFRWMSATRSTTLQMSKAHTGLCTDPEKKLDELYEQLVLVKF
jgi:hypothetical protein